MFYTATAKLLINKKGNDMEYLYIYILGSVCYVVLHHCLHFGERSNMFIDKLLNYFYYLVGIDIICAYILYRSTPVEKANNDENNSQRQQLTPEQKEMMMRRMQEARRYQLMRMKELNYDKPTTTNNIDPEPDNESKNDINEEANDKCKRPTSPNNDANKHVQPTQPSAKVKDNSHSAERKSIFSKSDESSDTNDSKKDKRHLNDTDIPIFNGK